MISYLVFLGYNMTEKVLIIDDDPKLNSLLKEYLTGFNFDIKTASLPSIGLKTLESWRPDLLIVDLMMPEQNGLDLCRNIRKKSNIPIIMLSAKGDTTDKIIGLEVGADDYLAKPFEPRELVARIRSQMRRKEKDSEETSSGELLSFGDIQLNKTNEEVKRGNEALRMTHKEFNLLWLLASKAPRIVSRDQIMNHLSGMDAGAFDRSIDVMISRIRQKLQDDAKKPKYIINVRNSGYKVIK